MNSNKICIIGLCFVILANAVTGQTCADYPATHEILETPFTFAYMLSADFNLIVRLKNASTRITGIAVTIYADGQLKSKNEWVPHIGAEYRVCGEASSYNQVVVGLELYSSNGLCATRLVSEGRHVRTLEYGLADMTYKSTNLCIGFSNSACAIEMDLRDDCKEIQIHTNADRKKSYVTPKPPHNIPDTTRHTPITSKPNKTRRTQSTAKPNKTRHTPSTPNREIPDIPKSTTKQSDNTGNTPITPKRKIGDPPKRTKEQSNKTMHTPSTPSRTIQDTQKSTTKHSDNTRHIPNTPQNKVTDTPKPNKTRHTPITPRRKITGSPKSTEKYPDNTRHTPTIPKGTIPDTVKPTNKYPDNTRHNPITPKCISNTSYIPDTIGNTSRTPKGKPSDTPKTKRNITDTTTSITSKPTITYNPIATHNISGTPKPTHNISDAFNKTIISRKPKATQNISDTQQAAQNKSYTPNGTQLMSNTTKTAELQYDDADVKRYITITIISAVSLMVLIVLVVIVRKCCCIKYNPSGSSQLLSNEIGSPFYLNMLFRKECDREIELIEQHHYEEIPPDRVSGTAANINGD